jgi:hypothetical protein
MSAALVIHPDGEITEVNFRAASNHLALMREHLGCSLVDCVTLTDQLDMWIDDEGIGTQPVNPVATALARHLGLSRQSYFGPVLLCGVDADGNSIDLGIDQVRALLTQLWDVVDKL